MNGVLKVVDILADKSVTSCLSASPLRSSHNKYEAACFKQVLPPAYSCVYLHSAVKEIPSACTVLQGLACLPHVCCKKGASASSQHCYTCTAMHHDDKQPMEWVICHNSGNAKPCKWDLPEMTPFYCSLKTELSCGLTGRAANWPGCVC